MRSSGDMADALGDTNHGELRAQWKNKSVDDPAMYDHSQAQKQTSASMRREDAATSTACQAV